MISACISLLALTALLGLPLNIFFVCVLVLVTLITVLILRREKWNKGWMERAINGARWKERWKGGERDGKRGGGGGDEEGGRKGGW